MRIPTPSDVLVVGASPVSLAFAVILAKGGLKVLVIDELPQPEMKLGNLKLSEYDTQFLKEFGFVLEAELPAIDFIAQSLKILATNLCSVIWDAKLLKPDGNTNQIMQAQALHEHQTAFIFKQNDLIIDVNNEELNFKNIFVLAWRLIGIQNQRLSKLVLNAYITEKNILFDYQEAEVKPNFFSQLLAKFNGEKIKSLNFKKSPTNLHLSQQRVLQAGELLPDLTFYDEKIKTTSSLYQWCNYFYLSLIIVGSLNPNFLFNLAKWVQLNYHLKLYYLPFSDRNETVFKALNISKTERRTFIIRPDKYIGFINDTVDVDIIDNYLRNVLMMIPKAEG